MVKCHLLGWWVDETKGYHLEDLKTKEHITSRGAHFIEDESPTNLATFNPVGEVLPTADPSKSWPLHEDDGTAVTSMDSGDKGISKVMM